MNDQINFLNIPLALTPLDQVRDQLLAVAGAPRFEAKSIHLVNAYTCQLFAGKSSNNPLTDSGSLNLVDSSWLARYLRFRYPGKKLGQVRGPSLFRATLASPSAALSTHVFVGSTNETLVKLRAAVEALNPVISRMHFISPPFTPLTEVYIDSLSSEILSLEPQIIWVGMGTPKQDFLSNALTAKTGITSVNVGAAFDFLAGTQKEAPKAFQATGLEWLYRLASEPKRLWRRYLIGNFAFVMLCLRDVFKK